jgi:hypothetical protein
LRKLKIGPAVYTELIELAKWRKAMVNVNLSISSQPSRRNNYWLIIPLIAVILIGALAVGFWMGSRSSSNQQPTGTQTQNQLTISSFKSEIMENDSRILAYLDLEVDSYWVEGNKVHCNGTVKWHTTEWTLENMNVALCIDRTSKSYTVDVELYVYGGILLLSSDTIDSDSVAIPKLGEQLFSYDFSLTCTYHQ